MKSIIIILIILLAASGIYNYITARQNASELGVENIGEMIVYKSPTCGCCENYIAYLKRSGFTVKVVNQPNMADIKDKYGVPINLGSCHTVIAGNYFIEGHMPIKAIQKLFAEKQNIKGIALPGMPVGSPGMAGVKQGAFEIQQVATDGSVSSYLDL